MRQLYKGLVGELKIDEIFVFGSNTEGRHGSGNAKFALNKCGAIYGNPLGLQGKSYAIVTTDLRSNKQPSIPEETIISQITHLYKYASDNSHLKFYIGYSGTDKYLRCGYDMEVFASFWKRAAISNQGFIPDNIIFEKEFYDLF